MKRKAKKIAFLDRDGVINKKGQPHTYITKVEDFVFNAGTLNFLRQLRQQGYELIIVTNQRGVARGVMTEQDLLDIHTFMTSELSKQGVDILDIFYCPHEKGLCECRKPKPGLLEQAVNKYDIDLASSILVSDFDQDIEMGKSFGIGQNVLIPADHPEYFYEQKN